MVAMKWARQSKTTRPGVRVRSRGSTPQSFRDRDQEGIRREAPPTVVFRVVAFVSCLRASGMGWCHTGGRRGVVSPWSGDRSDLDSTYKIAGVGYTLSKFPAILFRRAERASVARLREWTTPRAVHPRDVEASQLSQEPLWLRSNKVYSIQYNIQGIHLQ